MTKEEVLQKIKAIVSKDSCLKDAQVEVLFSDKTQPDNSKKRTLGSEMSAKKVTRQIVFSHYKKGQ